MTDHQHPENFKRLASGELFAFDCHSGVTCFTDCCRQLDLTLTPYDVLRLKNGLGLHSAVFLERYVIVEQEEGDIFPQLYLTMVDDGNASCVFVTKDGCSIYRDRPSACRTYPMGRGIMRKRTDGIKEFFILLREDHCHGFSEKKEQTPEMYVNDQGLINYYTKNDQLVSITQHDMIHQGVRPEPGQIEEFLLALYDIDTFREHLFNGDLDDTEVLSTEEKLVLEDDEKLLDYGMIWIRKRLFGSQTESGT